MSLLMDLREKRYLQTFIERKGLKFSAESMRCRFLKMIFHRLHRYQIFVKAFKMSILKGFHVCESDVNDEVKIEEFMDLPGKENQGDSISEVLKTNKHDAATQTLGQEPFRFKSPLELIKNIDVNYRDLRKLGENVLDAADRRLYAMVMAQQTNQHGIDFSQE
ncbi:hypothetical protein ACOME3_005336 [Neoechinorhynchus agilis]